MGTNQWGALPNQSSGATYNYVGQNYINAASPNAAAFQWDGNTYIGKYYAPTRDSSANAICAWCTVSIDPNHLSAGRTENWNLSFQYELNKDTVLDLQYIGNTGRHLPASELNPLNYPTLSNYVPLLKSGHAGDWITDENGAKAAGVAYLSWLVTQQGGYGGYNAYGVISPFPQIAGSGSPIYFVGGGFGSNTYNAMVVEVKKRGGHGLVADLNYALSRSNSNVNNDVNSYNSGNMSEGRNGSMFQDPYSYKQNAGLLASMDMTHQVKGYVTYELPFGKGKMFVPNANRWMNGAIGGWTLGTQVSYHTGLPLKAVSRANGYPGWSAVYANRDKSISLSRHFKKLNLANLDDHSNQYFTPSAFSDPAYGEFGNQKPYYTEFRGFGYSNEDLSILKKTQFGPDGRFRATFRAEFFNVFNRHHYNDPVAGSTQDQHFGNVTGVWGDPRKGQVGARFEW